MASVALIACALGFDGGCFSVLLWLLSVVVIGLGLLGCHWLGTAWFSLALMAGVVSSLSLLFQARSALL
jgi:hypothetical protein